ncbi:hypothetical protein B1R94_02310 [Mycolicibacterium litorale]|nr:hypothetical protein B1R94_02310 [Mycolicibacterium litorale]
MKFTRPDQLPATVAELDELANQARAEIAVIQARHAAGEELSPEDTERLEYLLDSRDEIVTERETVSAAEQAHTDKLAGLLDRVNPPTPEAPAAEAAPETPAATPEPGDAAAAAEVVAEAEAATAQAAEQPEPVTAAATGKAAGRVFAGAVTTTEVPKPNTGGDASKRWDLKPEAPNFAELGNQKVDTAAIAEGICSNGQFTGLNPDRRTIIASMERPQGKVITRAEDLYAELDRISSEIPGHGAVTAKALVAAGGWCAPSEQLYDFCETPAAVGLLSLPEMTINRGGVIFPAEPDFSALQNGFHFTETELEADSGSPNYTPTAIKSYVEIPCPPEMVEYRLEAIGWAVKSGILQKRAWPELVKKFLDEFMVAHEYRVSALTVTKILAQSSAAKVVPNDVVLGATTSILNGLHMRARNLQIKTRKMVIEGIAPLWFRDVLRADLAGRDDIAGLSVTDADVDRWLADRGIYLQYEGAWQSLTSGKPGHEDTSWWPGSVDVVLYPAGTFWRSRQNVLNLGVQFPMDLVQQNRQMEGFVEDEFQVGKRCYPSHLIRIPLCVNSAVGAREVIDCTTEYATTTTKTVTLTGSPTGGTITLKFSANGTQSGTIAYNASTSTVDSTLTAIDDNVTAAGDITVGGSAGAWVVTYPARLGDLQLGTNSLTGGTLPSATIS